MKINRLLHLLLLSLVIWPVTARSVEQEKGVILKITNSGSGGGHAVPQPLGDNPRRIVDELNAQGVTEVRVQVNNGEPMSEIIETGANATDTLAKFGFKGKVILDNKKWHLAKEGSQRAWVRAVYKTYDKMDAAGKAIVGGFSFGETTPTQESWKEYSKGVASAVQLLEHAFKDGGDPHGLKGKRFYVGGASYGGSFRELEHRDHETIKKAIEGVGGTLIYAYKSFHSMQGLPQPEKGDMSSKANAKAFLLNVVGLENLAKVAGQTEVQYRGNANDSIATDPELRAALIEIFNEHPNFLHVGAEVVLNNHGAGHAGGHLFDVAGNPQAGAWKALNSFAHAIRKKKRNDAGR